MLRLFLLFAVVESSHKLLVGREENVEELKTVQFLLRQIFTVIIFNLLSEP